MSMFFTPDMKHQRVDACSPELGEVNLEPSFFGAHSVLTHICVPRTVDSSTGPTKELNQNTNRWQPKRGPSSVHGEALNQKELNFEYQKPQWSQPIGPIMHKDAYRKQIPNHQPQSMLHQCQTNSAAVLFSGACSDVDSGGPSPSTAWWLSHPSEKYEFVNGKDDIPYRKWKTNLRRGGTKASACFLTRAGARETPPHPYGMAQT